VLKRKNAPKAGQGYEGAIETHYYEGTIPMTVLIRTARRILRLPAALALNAKVGHNLRGTAAEKGFTRATLQAATGETWLNTQRAWFGIEPLAQTVIMAHLAMRVDVGRILPTTPKSWA
jgi:hypothetical protein